MSANETKQASDNDATGASVASRSGTTAASQASEQRQSTGWYAREEKKSREYAASFYLCNACVYDDLHK